MNYPKNTLVILNDVKTEKLLVGSKISNKKLLNYMSDGTCYLNEDILMTSNELETLKDLCKEKFFTIFSRKRMVSDISKSLTVFYQKNKKLTKSD